jgi:protein SCO1
VSFRVRLAVFLAASFLVAAAFAATMLRADEAQTSSQSRFGGAIRPPGIPPAEFRMRDQGGRPATLADARGRPAVVTFLYTTCEDTCPLIGQQIRGALDRLGSDVPVFAVAVDPPRDTPERARRFLAAQRLTGRMRFLTGPERELQRQWRAYGIQPQEKGVEHSAHVVLLDKRGVQRVGYPADKLTPEALARDLRTLARERPAPPRAGDRAAS